jgi:hypothetical protein
MAGAIGHAAGHISHILEASAKDLATVSLSRSCSSREAGADASSVCCDTK